ncbi:hypothetical protein [Streptomyces sp. NRRL S-378]|uniref:hypothetical protein n=1 Tax=Streptomyces sp. NRRL S-378 TaxID=1463904 RepID=UPI0004C9B1AA|nr:hypothetical protein [Streptomyces sp. NRRL S-378]
MAEPLVASWIHALPSLAHLELGSGYTQDMTHAVQAAGTLPEPDDGRSAVAGSSRAVHGARHAPTPRTTATGRTGSTIAW